MSTAYILLLAFTLSVTGLFVFIWSLRSRLFDSNPEAAKEIFAQNEVGVVEDPSLTSSQRVALQQEMGAQPHLTGTQKQQLSVALHERIEADRSSAYVAFFFLSCAMVWLLVGSVAGLVSSMKLHMPDFLVDQAWLTFGRLRTVHLNVVAYGWAPMGAFGIAIWLLPRTLQTTLVGGRVAVAGGVIWNIGLGAGLACIAMGISDGMEWLEMPWQVDTLLVVGGALAALQLIFMLPRRRAKHLYVSVWYMGAALFWFPILFLVGNLPSVHIGVEQATMNWWFGHNVLGLFYTPMAVGMVYYFLSKIIGRPIASYNLSLLGFWGLAFFYGQVGGHHLIGGPVPGWMVTLSIVQSIMMIVPVLAFAVNQTFTIRGHLRAMLYSPTLRFIFLGGLMYIFSSVQGSFQALRSINTITHFTHFTVAHAHIGLYGFFTIVLFGAIYFVMPRVMSWEWPYPKLISWHFWLIVAGFSIYAIGLSIGGWLQGLYMLDATTPFIDSVTVTLPYLESRTVGGALVTVGHLVFAYHFVAMALRYGPKRVGPALFHPKVATHHAEAY